MALAHILTRHMKAYVRTDREELAVAGAAAGT